MSLARGLVGYAPAVIVPRLLALAQVTLLTRFIPQMEFGRLVLVITVGDAIDSLFCNWIRVILARFGAGRPDKLAEEATLALIAFGLVTLGLALPAGLAASLRADHDQAVGFFACLACYLVVNGISRIVLALLALRGMKLSLFLVETLRTGLGFTAVIALATTGTAVTFVPLIMVMNLATAVASVIGLVFALKGVGLRWPSHWGWDRRGYALPLVGGTVIGIALNMSDRIVTEAFAGPVALAVYAAAITLARQPLEFIFSVVNVRTFPELMEAYEKGGPSAGADRLADLVSVMSLLALPAAVGLALVAGPLAMTVLPHDYAETARVVIPLGALAGTCIGYKMFVFDQALHMTKTIWRNIVITGPAMVVCLGATAWLASRYGAVGCVLGLVAQALCAVAISIVQARKAIPLRVHWQDLTRIGMMCAVMALSVTLVLTVTAGWQAIVQLASGIAAGIIAYGLAGWLLQPRIVVELLPKRNESGTVASRQAEGSGLQG